DVDQVNRGHLTDTVFEWLARGSGCVRLIAPSTATDAGLLAGLNAVRRKHGLPPLKVDVALERAAREFSRVNVFRGIPRGGSHSVTVIIPDFAPTLPGEAFARDAVLGASSIQASAVVTDRGAGG